jgi:hypothetical protein
METVESLLSKGIHKNKKSCEAWWLFSICRTGAKGSMSEANYPRQIEEEDNLTSPISYSTPKPGFV